MKKLVMTVAVLACAASVVTAETVTSANMVGYTKVTAVGGELTLVALNFDTGGLTLPELVGDDLPTGSSIYLWDKSEGTYVTANKNRGGWDASPVVNLGDMLWIKAASGTNEIILSGEVNLAETNSVTLPAGLEGTGYFYPVETLLEDTALADQLETGSAIYIWNGNGYTTCNKNRGGWDANPSIGVAEGFWVKTSSSFTWEEPRPFNPSSSD